MVMKLIRSNVRLSTAESSEKGTHLSMTNDDSLSDTIYFSRDCRACQDMYSDDSFNITEA